MPPPARKALEAALCAVYTAFQTAHGETAIPPDILIPALADAALAVVSPPADPKTNSQNLTLADVCQREGLPLPPSTGTEDDPHELVLRSYRTPDARSAHWTVTNTGGRKYRFLPRADARIDRFRGTNWEAVPAHQTPTVVAALRAAVAAAHPPTYQEIL